VLGHQVLLNDVYYASEIEEVKFWKLSSHFPEADVTNIHAPFYENSSISPNSYLKSQQT